jgi:hypothetical protein
MVNVETTESGEQRERLKRREVDGLYRRTAVRPGGATRHAATGTATSRCTGP